MPGSPVRESPIAGLAVVPLALLLHNAEEALLIRGSLPRIAELSARLFGGSVALPTPPQYHAALAFVSILGLTIYVAARWRPAAAYGLVVLQAVMALNVVSHSVVAFLLPGYAPGLATAWLVEAPVSWAVFRRAKRTKWMTAWQWRLLMPLALLFHGPLLFGMLRLARSL